MKKENRPSLRELSDEELMQRYILGEIEAFNELHRRHAPKIYGYLTGRLKSQAVVDDVYQEVFLRLHRFRGRYDRTIPFVPWLFTVTRNAMIDNQRRQRTIEEHEQSERMSSEDALSSSAVPQPAISGYLEGLSEREKKILTLHLQNGFSFSEIASDLKISSSNVRKISSRAIQKLRRIWK